MQEINFKNFHLIASLSIFLICLALPAFYVNEDYEPLLSLPIFMAGWLGVFDWNFAWFANLFFIISIISRKKPQTSTALAFVALAISITFLFYKTIMLGLTPGYNKIYGKIVGYGWGYFLWVIAIGIFFIGQLTRKLLDRPHGKIQICAINFLFVAISTTLFIHHFYISNKGAHTIVGERRSAFEDICSSAKDKIYKPITEEIDTVYVRNGFRIEYEGNFFNHWKMSSSGSLEASIPHITFYETDNEDRHRSGRNPSLYKSRNRKTHEESYSNDIKSRYMIEISTIPFSKRLGIVGYRTTITDLTDNTLVAETSYFHQKKGGRLCGEASGRRFSSSDFFLRVLPVASG